MRTAIRILKWMGLAIIALVVLLLGFMLIGPRLGWETHAVLSGSMEPALDAGGVILTRPVKEQDLRVGDIILFESGELRVAHRVVEIVEEGGKLWFRTKGDANDSPDPDLISFDGGETKKVAFDLPYLGFLARAMSNRYAFLLVIAIPALLLIVSFAGDVREGIRELRAGKGVKTGGRGH